MRWKRILLYLVALYVVLTWAPQAIDSAVSYVADALNETPQVQSTTEFYQ